MDDVQSRLERCKRLSRELRCDELVSKYGTFLDSKADVMQLYLIFVCCGIATNWGRDECLF